MKLNDTTSHRHHQSNVVQKNYTHEVLKLEIPLYNESADESSAYGSTRRWIVLQKTFDNSGDVSYDETELSDDIY